MKLLLLSMLLVQIQPAHNCPKTSPPKSFPNLSPTGGVTVIWNPYAANNLKAR